MTMDIELSDVELSNGELSDGELSYIEPSDGELYIEPSDGEPSDGELSYIEPSDESHEAGFTLSLSITWNGRDEPSECTATVIKAFTPFTKSQVLLVNVHGAPDGTPPSMVLKTYDPRFFDEREKPSKRSWIPARPWSLEKESAAAERRAAVTRGEREGDYNGRDGDEFDRVDWEVFFYRTMQNAFQSELEAYTRLEKLQGEGIARCYGFGVLHPSIKRPVSPHVLLLEYVPGETLASVDPTRVSCLQARSLITTAHAFRVYGVFHNDIRTHNIVFSPEGPTALTRAVILDFGHAGLLRDDEPDDEPAPMWEESSDERMMRDLLSDLKIRDVDPQRQEIFLNKQGVVAWNRWAETEGRRWCEPTDEPWAGPEQGTGWCEPTDEPWAGQDEGPGWGEPTDEPWAGPDQGTGSGNPGTGWGKATDKQWSNQGTGWGKATDKQWSDPGTGWGKPTDKQWSDPGTGWGKPTDKQWAGPDQGTGSGNQGTGWGKATDKQWSDQGTGWGKATDKQWSDTGTGWGKATDKRWAGPDQRTGSGNQGMGSGNQGTGWGKPTDKQCEWAWPEHIKLKEPVRWKLKDEVTAWLDAKDAGLLVGPTPPRPGSPDFVPIA